MNGMMYTSCGSVCSTSSTGRIALRTRGLSAAQTPSGIPMSSVKTIATSTCDSVSIASAHSSMTPIIASIRSVVTAARRPETKNAIPARPNTIAGHGVSTKKLLSGVRQYWTRKFPTGFVMWKMNVDGFWT